MMVIGTARWNRGASSALLAVLSSTTALAQEGTASQGGTEQNAVEAPGESTLDAKTGLLPLPDYGGNLLDRSVLTGDWNGARDALASDAGVQIDMDLTQYLQGIADGGNGKDTDYGGRFSTRLRFDLMRMGIVPGALVEVRTETRYGNFIGPNSGMLLPVNLDAIPPETQPPYGDYGLAVTNLTYTQFFNDRFAAYLGKIDTFSSDQNEFATGGGKTQFMNFNFNFAAPAAFVPASLLGVGFLFAASEHLSVSSTLFSATNASNSNALDDIDGGISATELRTQYRLGDLPGGVNGSFVYFFDQDFQKLGGEIFLDPGEGLVAETKDESWLTVFSGWQYVYTEEAAGEGPMDLTNGRPDLQGLGLFGRIAFADEDTNPWKFASSAGIGGRGLIPGREDDQLGAGYFWNDVDDDRFDLIGSLLESSNEGVEVFYNMALSPAIRLTFDMQWINSSFSGVDDAYLFGLRLMTSF